MSGGVRCPRSSRSWRANRSRRPTPPRKRQEPPSFGVRVLCSLLENELRRSQARLLSGACLTAFGSSPTFSESSSLLSFGRGVARTRPPRRSWLRLAGILELLEFLACRAPAPESARLIRRGRGALAELRKDAAELRRELNGRDEEDAKLRVAPEGALRAGKRQAAPFSRNPPQARRFEAVDWSIRPSLPRAFQWSAGLMSMSAAGESQDRSTDEQGRQVER